MKIGGLELENNLMLAPLAGMSDVGFRAVCASQGAAITFSEMLSAQAMKHNSKKTADMTVTHPDEKIKFAQIFGHEAQVMAQAASSPLLADFDGIDINMGCPAPKVVKNGDGSALLKNLSLAGEIISAVKNATKKPVSVKVRLGFQNENIAQIVRACQESGADFITVHGRTREQGYAGKVNLEAIALAKSVATVPIVGNGDVVDLQSFQNMLATNVDGVMIGRGALGRPWIFSELLGRECRDKFDLILRHVQILREHYPEKWLVLYLRKHFLSYAAAFKAGGEAKRQLAISPSIDESLEILKEQFNHFEIF